MEVGLRLARLSSMALNFDYSASTPPLLALEVFAAMVCFLRCYMLNLAITLPMPYTPDSDNKSYLLF